jgi:hypothetical protein
MERLTPMHVDPDPDGGDRLFRTLVRAAERSASAVSDRLARSPANGDAEVVRRVDRAD